MALPALSNPATRRVLILQGPACCGAFLWVRSLRKLIFGFLAFFFSGASVSQVDLSREGGIGYHCLKIGQDAPVSSHATQHKATESCINAALNDPGEYEVQASGRIRVGISEALAQSYPADGDNARSVPAPAGNDPPVWNSTPNPFATEGVASSYDVSQHFQDPEGDTITLADGGGCTLPTGVTVDDTNDELDFSTGTSAGTTTGCTLTIDDGTNPAVTSATFEIEIFAAGAGITVDDSGGKDYTTIQAAINNAACGETIFVYTGTYGAFATTQNCAANNPITVKAESGQSPDVTGFSTQGGEEAHVHCSHTGFVFGEGMTFTGTNNTVYQSPPTGDPETNIHIEADNCTFKGTATKGRLVNVLLENVDNVILSGAHLEIAGTHDDGTVSNPDGGQNLEGRDGAVSNLFVYNTFMGEGGHNGIEVTDHNHTNLRYEENRVRNNWDLVYSGTTNRGNRAGRIEGDNVVFRRNVFSEIRMAAADNNGRNPAIKFNSENASMSEQFFLDQTSGGPAISFQNVSGESFGSSSIYLDHMTIYKMDGACYTFLELGHANYGPFYLKNVICSDIKNAPGDGRNQRCVYYRYDSQYAGVRGDWEQSLFIDGMALDVDCDVRIEDMSGPNIDGTITWFETNYPANFKNIVIGDPNFVSTTVSASEDPATALSSAQTNFLPQAAALLDTGVALTQVNGSVSSSVTVTVDDAGWFRNAMGFSEATTDAIFLCGQATTISSIAGNVLTLNDAVTCSDNADVFRGTDGTPNYGAVIN